jgi:hypothetical protein
MKKLLLLTAFILPALYVQCQTVTVQGTVMRASYNSQQQMQQATYKGTGYWVNDIYAGCTVMVFNMGPAGKWTEKVDGCEHPRAVKAKTDAKGVFELKIKAAAGDKLRIVYDCSDAYHKDVKVTGGKILPAGRYTIKNLKR